MPIKVDFYLIKGFFEYLAGLSQLVAWKLSYHQGFDQIVGTLIDQPVVSIANDDKVIIASAELRACAELNQVDPK